VLDIRGKVAILERQGEVVMGAERSDQLYLILKPPMKKKTLARKLSTIQGK
jgi:hypothetical protein